MGEVDECGCVKYVSAVCVYGGGVVKWEGRLCVCCWLGVCVKYVGAVGECGWANTDTHRHKHPVWVCKVCGCSE